MRWMRAEREREREREQASDTKVVNEDGKKVANAQATSFKDRLISPAAPPSALSPRFPAKRVMN